MALIKKAFVITLFLVIISSLYLSAVSASAQRLFPDSYYENEVCPPDPNTKICIDFYKDTGKTPKAPTTRFLDNNKESKIQIVEADLTIFVDGKELSFEQKPMLYDGSTLVPMRKIFEALGAKVDWDDGLKLAKAKTETTEIRIGIGKNIAYVNNVEMPVLVPAQIINGFTMVPARFIAESLGAKVEYDGTNKTITITTNAKVSSQK